MDGRLFLRTTDLKFDVIIVDLPDPQTAQLNRFYTLEFFREAADKLTQTGVFSFQLKGSEDYISADLGEFLRCIDKTLRQVFPEVVTIPGDTVHFFAAADAGSLANSAQELITRMRARGIRAQYVGENYLPYRMMPDRMLELETQIRPEARTRTNRDFTPIAYYFDVALWSTKFNNAYRRIFQTIAADSFWFTGNGDRACASGNRRNCGRAVGRRKSRASQRGILRRSDGIHLDGAGTAAFAGISGDLWIRVPATGDHHRWIHVGDGGGELVGVAPRRQCGWNAGRAATVLPANIGERFASRALCAV
jgi:hypothetical protein